MPSAVVAGEKGFRHVEKDGFTLLIEVREGFIKYVIMDVAELHNMLYGDGGQGGHYRRRKCNDREAQKSMTCCWTTEVLCDWS